MYDFKTQCIYLNVLLTFSHQIPVECNVLLHYKILAKINAYESDNAES